MCLLSWNDRWHPCEHMFYPWLKLSVYMNYAAIITIEGQWKPSWRLKMVYWMNNLNVMGHGWDQKITYVSSLPITSKLRRRQTKVLLAVAISPLMSLPGFGKLQTDKFQGLFKDKLQVFKDSDLFNKSAFFNLLWSPYWLKHDMGSFTIFTSSAIIDHIISATRNCKMTGYDLQLHLRYRNSIWNKEMEIKIIIVHAQKCFYVTHEFYRFLRMSRIFPHK